MKKLRKQDYLLMIAGRSLALQAKYKPKILHEFANIMVRDIPGGYLEISDVLEDLCDAYEKLGRMLYAKKTIEELDPGIPYFDLVVDYHVSSFLFHCKAFLDSISNAICHAFDLDIKKVVNVDITRLEFNKKLAQKKPHLTKTIEQSLNWATYVVNYRMDLIHKYRFFSFSKDLTFKKIEILLEPTRPLTFFDKEQFDAFTNELEKKYGKSTVCVQDFCKYHSDNAKRLFEMVVSEFLKEIHHNGHDVFGWERVHPLHIGEAISFKKGQ